MKEAVLECERRRWECGWRKNGPFVAEEHVAKVQGCDVEFEEDDADVACERFFCCVSVMDSHARQADSILTACIAADPVSHLVQRIS